MNTPASQQQQQQQQQRNVHYLHHQQQQQRRQQQQQNTQLTHVFTLPLFVINKISTNFTIVEAHTQQQLQQQQFTVCAEKFRIIIFHVSPPRSEVSREVSEKIC